MLGNVTKQCFIKTICVVKKYEYVNSGYWKVVFYSFCF